MSSVNIHTERRESLELASMHVDKVFRTRMETTFQCNLIFSGTSADATSKYQIPPTELSNTERR